MRPIVLAAFGLSTVLIGSTWLASGCAAGSENTSGSSKTASSSGSGGGGTGGHDGGFGGEVNVGGKDAGKDSGNDSGDGGSGGSGTGGQDGGMCVPSPEICDGLDNDCDGMIDNGLMCNCKYLDVQDCYSGPAVTEGVGLCHKGSQTCDQAGQWGPCANEVTPQPEVCDGLDNDCDSNIDNGFGPVTCGVGICTQTVDSCVNGMTVNCVPDMPKPEICNGADDNCDGTVDENCNCIDGQIQSCYTGAPNTLGVGECAAGTQTCANGQWGTCMNEVLPDTETCDAKDNDCNGQVDDGLGTTVCGVGACKVTTQNCIGGITQVCTPGQPVPETCNNIDDNCNGQVDDGLGTISCGLGICANTVPFCVNGVLNVCNPLPASVETCNGLDDNCNGFVDDGNPGGGMACMTGNQGVCGPGTTSCQNAQVICVQNVQPSNESCNNLDDNCNGQIDEGDPGGGVGCNTGLLGACAAGTTSCQNGLIKCNQNTPSAPETCDGLDNNCNGATDEGNPGGGVACNTGLQGVCSAGLTNCQNGGIVCTQTTQASNEICDNKDNNCNGSVDEGDPGGGGACNTGLQGVCSVGTFHCVNGMLVCQQNVMPSPETCDGLDNNCNGQIDEGDPGGGVACSTGLLGVCNAGTKHCVSGVLACQQNVMPSAETCDGLDNNCNGSADEGNPGGGGGCTTGLQGVCSTGTMQCQNGSLSCVQNVMPSVEICDGLDNNCNGQADEGNPGGGAGCNTGLLGVCSGGTITCQAGALSCKQNVMSSTEVCGDNLDNNCDGLTDLNALATPADGIPNSCANAGNLTFNVSKGQQTDVSGTVDPLGDDYFRVNFVSVPGVGQGYHPKIDLIASGGGQYVMEVLTTACAATSPCGTFGTTWEFNFANNPNSCQSFGNCTDNNTRYSSVIVHVKRAVTGSNTTCTPWTVRINYF